MKLPIEFIPRDCNLGDAFIRTKLNVAQIDKTIVIFATSQKIHEFVWMLKIYILLS